MQIRNNSGHKAELKAAEFLINHGYDIVDVNCKTPVCEIDIIAKKDNRTYFVEVKYRKKSTWGMGLDYITSKKQKQMVFAAECWVEANKYKGDYSLSAIEIAGEEFDITSFLPEI